MQEIDKVEYPPGVQSPFGLRDAQELVGKMLLAYVHFLNMWSQHYYSEMAYAADGSDFYSRQILAAYRTDWYWVVVLQVYEGDEGGPSVLTGYFEVPVVDERGGPNLDALVQEFDTRLQFIYNDGSYLNTPNSIEED